LTGYALVLRKTSPRPEPNAEYQKAVAEKKQLENELAGPKKAAYEQAKVKWQEAEFEAFDKRQNHQGYRPGDGGCTRQVEGF